MSRAIPALPPASAQSTGDVVAMRCVAVVGWTERGPQAMRAADLKATRQRRTDADASPIWIQLALPNLSAAAQAWFEGSVDPWMEAEPPAVCWTPAVSGVLDAAGLAWEDLRDDETRLLERVPFLYERGVLRTEREIWGRPSAAAPGESAAKADLTFFPAVSFLLADDPNGGPPAFWTVRITIAVIRNVVLTVRLPDMRRLYGSRELHYAPGRVLQVPARFFPAACDLTAHDVAEGIALHQAATARAVAQNVREDLIVIDRASTNEPGRETATARKRALDDAARVTALTETTFHLDHQLSRLLRRVGDGDAEGRPGRSVSSQVARRYRWALDELRSLEADCRLTAESVSQAVSAHEHEERERFQFVAAGLATAILVPALVASLYGANVALPGKGGGFAGLVACIIASGVGALLLVSEAGRRGWKTPDWRMPHPWQRGQHGGRRR